MKMILLSSLSAMEANKMHFRFTWKREWTWILIVFLTLRLVYSFLGAVAVSDGLPKPLDGNEYTRRIQTSLHTDPVSQTLVNVWLRWDTTWYLIIADSGYGGNDGSIAFLPLYPWLIQLTGFLLGGNLLLGAILVSNLAGLTALILLYELISLERVFKTNPIQSVLALLLFPSAFFLFAAYTESLFLMLILAACLCAQHKRWLAAGTLAALATLCRLQGILLMPVLLWFYLAAAAEARGMQPLAQIQTIWKMFTTSAEWKKAQPALLQPDGFAIFLPGVALLAYLGWLHYSNLGTTSQALKNFWGIQTVMPWEGFRLFLGRLFSRQRVFIDYIDLGTLLLMLIVCTYAIFRLDPAYSIYNWLSISLFFMRGTPPHLLDSFSRYLLLLFPAFLIFGAIQNRRLAIFFGSLSFIIQLFLVMGFLDWRWVA
jgi:hypothetical protein